VTILITTRKIAAAGTSSEAFDAGGATEGSFTIPSTFTGSTVQAQFSNNQTNWTNVDSPISVAANGTYPIPSGVFKAAFGRLLSSSAEAAERIITLGLRRG
jgi:hypothetical protein